MCSSRLLLVKAVLEEEEGGVGCSILVVGKAQGSFCVHGFAKEAASKSAHLGVSPNLHLASSSACLAIDAAVLCLSKRACIS